MSDSVVWNPSDELRARSNWALLFRQAGVRNIEELNARAAQDPEWFWNELIRFQQFPFLKPYTKVLDLSGGIEFPNWCVGGTTNITLACLDRHRAAGHGDELAVIFESEDGGLESLTYEELYQRTCRLASGLERLGLKAGDCVGLYMPLMTDSVIAFLALARLGCIVLPLFSGFGPAAIIDRLNDGKAVALITVDAAMRRGRRVDMISIAIEAAREIPSLAHIVVKNRFNSDLTLSPGRDHDMDQLSAAGDAEHAAKELPAEAPLMIVYTSGTTGKPKGTVHTHCGFGIKTAQDLHLIFDVKRGDRLLWMTDMGWLVGPVQTVGGLMAGATLVLAEGVPDFPEPDRLWHLIERHRVSVLGLSPTAARLMIQAGIPAVAARDLSSVRLIASTGEPWDATSWMWIFDHVLQRRGPLLNYSGGTEMGGILASHLLAPLRPASLHGPLPGTGADIVDENGLSVGVGEVGELVMRAPCIGTTRGLWNDREKYLDTYWRRFPGMWVHGDWASRDAHGVWRLHGRSDDTIKLAGKRTGPAEIEAALMASGLCADAAAVAVPDAVAGSALVCAVVPVAGKDTGPAFETALRDCIASALGAAYRPKRIVVLDALPKTRNLKTMRRVIRALLIGEEPGDLSSLLNPESLDPIRAAGAGK
jgi:acetyl-CoA synthetase